MRNPLHPGDPFSNNSEVVVQEVRVSVDSDLDIITARKMGRALAAQGGFSSTEMTLIATAISELSRNIVMYAGRGEVVLRLVHQGDSRGMVVIARDDGPGIVDVRQALQNGFTTSKSLGLGLPGVRRLVDEFAIESELGKGTTVTAKTWRR